MYIAIPITVKVCIQIVSTLRRPKVSLCPCPQEVVAYHTPHLYLQRPKVSLHPFPTVVVTDHIPHLYLQRPKVSLHPFPTVVVADHTPHHYHRGTQVALHPFPIQLVADHTPHHHLMLHLHTLAASIDGVHQTFMGRIQSPLKIPKYQELRPLTPTYMYEESGTCNTYEG